MVKKIILRTLSGIQYGCLWIVAFGIIGNVFHVAAFEAILTDNFIAHGFGGMLVGVGFVLPTLIYDAEKLSAPVKTLIHLGIGFGIFFPVAFGLRWLPGDLSVGVTLIIVLDALVIGVLIWLGFYLYFRNESRRINARLRQLEERETP
jgi:hypothetical protein